MTGGLCSPLRPSASLPTNQRFIGGWRRAALQKGHGFAQIKGTGRAGGKPNFKANFFRLNARSFYKNLKFLDSFIQFLSNVESTHLSSKSSFLLPRKNSVSNFLYHLTPCTHSSFRAKPNPRPFLGSRTPLPRCTSPPPKGMQTCWGGYRCQEGYTERWGFA